MKQFNLLIISLFCAATTYSQCDDGRYRDIIFSELDIQTDINYGENVDYLGVTQSLDLDVYQPADDTETERPLVIFAHGGSFITGSKQGPDVVPLCRDLASMGYVTASIEYRLGINILNDLTQAASEAVLRGYHDMKAAIRFMRKSVAEDGNPYGIDPDQIFIAGVSAGGFITLHTAYMDDLNEIPENIDQNATGLTGGLEGDTGNDGYSSEVSAVINICGALGDVDWIQTGDEPVLSFHGPFDTTVPYGSETLSLFGFPVIDVEGSSSVHVRAEEVGLTQCFEIYEDQGHVPHTTNQEFYDTTRAVIRNFLSHLICPMDINLDCEYEEVVNTSVLENQEANKMFLVYPNPSRGLVKVELNSREAQTIQIHNSVGQLVRELTIEFEEISEIDLTDLPDGIYQISSTVLGEVNSQKLLIQR